ncbi:farnesyl pyrophosphate synthetase putative-like protein [Leptotrombidium deliense]|uniref:Farnesyl pyrophosphate synthetase putative-like protein n=1 Tax=Leptotrombidium deliense TaxID=299467 RepID=A0A443S5G4_9ACAR|nr:farnesyl pyrophosphate synthetase putative-like protein [Leptotrombidium deliense]
MDELFDHAVYGGKMLRTKIILHVFNEIATNKEKEELREKAMILGICVQLCITAILVIDDVMDEAETRREKTCWHKLENSAVIHANMMNSFVYTLLKKYFRNDPNYSNFLEAFMNTEHVTYIGQNMDDNLSNPKELEKYKMPLFKKMATLKTAHCTFVLSVKLCLYLLNITDTKLHDWATHLCEKIGILFQAQDDYIDVYGDSNVTGKIGTDIKNGKCTWMVVTSLTIMNKHQRKLFQLHFGKPEEASESIVKEIFQQIKLDEKFQTFETESMKDIEDSITEVDENYKNIAESITHITKFLHRRNK